MDGSAEGAARTATNRARRRTAPPLHTHTSNRLARTGSFRWQTPKNTFCRSATQTKRTFVQRSGGPKLPRQYSKLLRIGLQPPLGNCLWNDQASLIDPQQAQQVRRQRRKLRARHPALRVYHTLPSCRYLLAMSAHYFPHAPPDAIAHHRAAVGLLNP